MKLIFPNGEHEPIALEEGVMRVGSAVDCTVVLTAAGVAARHCEIETRGGHSVVRPLASASPTVLNGRQITQETPLKPGDLLLFGRIGCRIGSDRPAAAATMPPPSAKKTADEAARTRVRNTLPKFMLRGVSGPTFGKTFALAGTMVIGRQNDSDIPVAAEEISRHHARLQVTPEGVLVEDMSSANGTFINDKRVQSGMLKPGEELRLDTVRFLLVAPGMDAKQQGAAARTEPAKIAPSAAQASGGRTIGIVVAIVVIAAIAFGVARYFGIA
ncbi:MAG TPA: FHA domain-containing protein [Rhodanobacteraceae bacterium]|nr:FHA domain-containing protein [Rhodanobacteraceae bacterium]